MKFVNSLINNSANLKTINIILTNNNFYISSDNVYNLIIGFFFKSLNKTINIKFNNNNLKKFNNNNITIHIDNKLLFNFDLKTFFQILELFDFNIKINNFYYKDFFLKNSFINFDKNNIFNNIIYHFYVFILSSFSFNNFFNFFYEKYTHKHIDILFLSQKIIKYSDIIIDKIIHLLNYFNNIFIKNFIVLNTNFSSQEEIIIKFLNINYFFVEKYINTEKKIIIDLIDSELF